MVSTLFGSQMGTIKNTISQKTGLPHAAFGKILKAAPFVIMSYVGKMIVQQKMDTQSHTTLLGDRSKITLQSSPDIAGMTQQLLSA